MISDVMQHYPKRSFDDIYNTLDLSTIRRTPLGAKSLLTIYQYGLMANKIDGLAAEAGVYTGASLYTLANVFDREIHAFDSFEGLPEPGIYDDGQIMVKGGFACSLDYVKGLLSCTNKVIYHKGFFSETLSDFDSDVRFSYVFCDVDFYQSVIECFDFFYPRLNAGGVMLCDDYYCDHTPGATKAIDEMIIKYDIVDVCTVDGFILIEKR